MRIVLIFFIPLYCRIKSQIMSTSKNIIKTTPGRVQLKGVACNQICEPLFFVPNRVFKNIKRLDIE